MSSSPRYEPGTWLAICDRCGFKFKASQLRKDWQGYMVCDADWEQRHPQDFLKVHPETAVPAWTRPEPTDTFVEVDYIATTTGEQEPTVPSGTYSPEEPSL